MLLTLLCASVKSVSTTTARIGLFASSLKAPVSVLVCVLVTVDTGDVGILGVVELPPPVGADVPIFLAAKMTLV